MRKVGGRAGVLAGMLAGVLLACCACAAALDPSLDISQYAHTSWKIRDGFTKGIIFSIAQTPDGYLWLGTEFGLVRSDGARLTEWQPPAGQRLPSQFIRTLLVARDGTLWIGTQKGLSSFKNGKLATYSELNGQRIMSLLQDRDGTVWVGALEPPSIAKLCAYRTDGIQCQANLFGAMILTSYEDRAGNLWLGTANGFWRWKPGRSEFFELNGRLSGFGGFLDDNQSGILIGTSAGLSRLANGRIEPYALPGVANPPKVTKLLRDHDGGLWIATADQGLVHVHQGRTDRFSQAQGLSGDFIADLFEDRERNIWVVTSNGLDRFRSYAVTNISIDQGLNNDVVNAVLASNDSSVWIATGGGLSRWKDGQVSLFGSRDQDGKLNGLPPRTLFQDSSGRIWVSTNREFGYLEGDRFRAIPDVPGLIVGDIVEVGKGHLWIRHQDGLLHLFQGKLVQRIPWAGLGHSDIGTALATDPSQEGLWIGFMNGGVGYFAGGGLQKSYSAANGLGAGIVENLRFGANGDLWAATEGGLSRIRDDHISTLTSKNGLPCDTVHWSIEDDDHSVWLNESCGLVRIDSSELDAWVGDPTRRIQTTRFDITDGVLSRNSNAADRPTVTKSPDGKIWFAGIGGVSIIDPHHLAVNKLPPPVHIEQVTADDKTYDAANGLRLPPRVRYLTIDYTALSLVAPEKVRFRYKLEGEDKDWREVVNKREVEYTNLGPKHYRFRVLACNNSGVWNEQGASLEFVIPPAWYQTNWFYALCAATFLLMLWGLYQLRVLQLQREFNTALEARVGERTRVARDLHDTLLQSFHGLLLRFAIVQRLLPNRVEEAQKELQRAMELATAAITEGRDAVQGLRDSTIETNDLVAAIKTIGEELAAKETNQSSAKFAVRVEGASRELRPLLRDEVYRIAMESLRNAFRHANASRVEAEIRYGDKQFRLRIVDDGKGIDPTLLTGDGPAGHYGLRGMRERAQLAGGKLAVWSEINGGGTEVELTIPARNAYEEAPRSSWWAQRFSGKESDVQETKIES